MKKLLTDINEIKKAKIQMDATLEKAFRGIVRTFKEKTNLNPGSIEVEIVQHYAHRHGTRMADGYVVFAIKTSVEI